MSLLKIKSFIGTHDKDWEDADYYQHDSVEITIVLEGRGWFRYENTQYAIESGHIILIPAKIPHSFHALSPIRFGVLLIEGLPTETQLLFNQLLSSGPKSANLPYIIALSKFDQEQYELLFRHWLRVVSSILKEPQKQYAAWIQVLLLFINEHAQSDQQALSMTRAADYIRDNLQSGIHISGLATLAGLTEEGFRKRFYNVYQMTPKQYHQMCKLSEAKWLLSSSDKDVQAIAELVGFSLLHSFSTWFKKLEGTSPSEWRKIQRLYHS